MSNDSSSFVKLFRKMLHWEWYKNTNTKVLFLHCLLRASWEPGDWSGIHYEAGQFVTSVSSLSEETGLTLQEVRTALAHLELTGEITRTITHESTEPHKAKCSVITINNWGKYQKPTRVATRKPTRKAATIKEIKEKEDAASRPDGAAAATEEDDECEWMDAFEDRERAMKEHEE